MKRQNIWWGLGLISVAALLILNSVGVSLGALNGLPVISIILTLLCIAWAISTIAYRQAYFIFFPLAIIFMLFEKNIAELCGIGDTNIINNWLLLLCAVLLCIGTAVLFPHKAGNMKKYIPQKSDAKEHRFSSTTKYIDCSGFTTDSIDLNMGSCEIFFENTESYQTGGVLNVDVNMSSLVVHVPAEWRVECTVKSSMGKVSCPKCGSDDRKILYIAGENNMGSVNITQD